MYGRFQVQRSYYPYCLQQTIPQLSIPPGISYIHKFIVLTKQCHKLHNSKVNWIPIISLFPYIAPTGSKFNNLRFTIPMPCKNVHTHTHAMTSWIYYSCHGDRAASVKQPSPCMCTKITCRQTKVCVGHAKWPFLKRILLCTSGSLIISLASLIDIPNSIVKLISKRVTCKTS